MTAGELKSRGYYQGSNVSYNLKKLVELGYMHHQRSEIDRRSVRVRLTEKGRRIRAILTELFARQAEQLDRRGMIEAAGDGRDQHFTETDGAVLDRADPLHLLANGAGSPARACGRTDNASHSAWRSRQVAPSDRASGLRDRHLPACET